MTLLVLVVVYFLPSEWQPYLLAGWALCLLEGLVHRATAISSKLGEQKGGAQ